MAELYNQVIAYRLTRLRDPANITNVFLGICYNLRAQDPGDYAAPTKWLEAAFKKLGLSNTYPVPSPYDDYRTPDEAYNYHEDLWHGKYGANRLYLLELLISLAGGWEPSENFRVHWPHPPTKETE